MRIMFRADASENLGTGHVMRCLALADELAGMGHQCAFATATTSPAAVPPLAPSGHEIVLLDDAAGEDAAPLAAYWPEGADWLVVDHYNLDREFESACRPWAKRILSIDDLADRPHDCDLLLDQTLGRNAGDYAELLPAGAEALVGPRYALIRPQFAACRAQALDRRLRNGEIRRILISLGGSDPLEITPRVLEGIDLSGTTARIDVIAGTGKSANVLDDLVRRMSAPVTLHAHVDDMASLMSAADVAIGAGGTTSWERCCLGLPSLLVVTADNQREIAEALQKEEAAEILGWHSDVEPACIAQALKRLIAAPEKFRSMSVHAAGICDGQGLRRACERLS